MILDYKRDYTKPDFVDAVGARVVSPHRIPLNVFDLPAAREHLPPARLGRVKFLNDVLQKIYGGIGPRQRNHLKIVGSVAPNCCLDAPDSDFFNWFLVSRRLAARRCCRRAFRRQRSPQYWCPRSQ